MTEKEDVLFVSSDDFIAFATPFIVTLLPIRGPRHAIFCRRVVVEFVSLLCVLTIRETSVLIVLCPFHE